MSSNPEKRSEYFILHNPPDMWIQSECGFSHFAFQQSSSLPIFTHGLFVSLTYGCLLHSWCLMRGLEEREWGLWPWCWKWVIQASFIQVISHTIIHTDFFKNTKLTQTLPEENTEMEKPLGSLNVDSCLVATGSLTHIWDLPSNEISGFLRFCRQRFWEDIQGLLLAHFEAVCHRAALPICYLDALWS